MKDQPMNHERANGHVSTLDRMADAAEEPSSRRNALGTLGKLGLGAAALSVASFLGARPRKAVAQEMPEPIEVLTYALTLEYLEFFFYQEGTDSGVIPMETQDVFELIEKHEDSHVATLRQAIMNLGGNPPEFTSDDFDYTAGGAFHPFDASQSDSYAQFLLLSQGFEDTGVRAYKGQAPNLLGTALLTPALQIHSLEARHAAQVRRIRDDRGAMVKPWIVLDGPPADSPISAVYSEGVQFPSEANTTQAGVELTELGDGYPAEAASASFDEPFLMQPVLSIADPFSDRIDGPDDDSM